MTRSGLASVIFLISNYSGHIICESIWVKKGRCDGSHGQENIGALLYTEDKDHFEIIKGGLKTLRVEYV